MRTSLLVLLAMSAACRRPVAERAPVDVVALFSLSPPALGCWLEKRWGHRDEKWNCDLKGWNRSGDPCDDTEPYYGGPATPDSVAKRMGPRLWEIDLEWEHGDLRSVSLAFDGPVTEAEARRTFGLPPEGVPPGLMFISLQDCSRRGTCLIVEKFEHQGAGDVDCDAVRAERARR